MKLYILSFFLLFQCTHSSLGAMQHAGKASAIESPQFIDDDEAFINEHKEKNGAVLVIYWYADQHYDLFLSRFNYFKQIKTSGLLGCISVILYNAKRR